MPSSTLLTTPRGTSPAVTGTRIPLLELPHKVRIRLISQNLRNEFRARPQIPALAKHLRTLNINLPPPRLDQPADARPVHLLFETGPSNSTGTHRAAFGIRVQSEIAPCGRGFGCGEFVRTVGVGEDGGAVADCYHFTVEGWVAGCGVLVYAGADQFAEAVVAGGVVDDGCAEGCERARGSGSGEG